MKLITYVIREHAPVKDKSLRQKKYPFLMLNIEKQFIRSVCYSIDIHNVYKNRSLRSI